MENKSYKQHSNKKMSSNCKENTVLQMELPNILY